MNNLETNPIKLIIGALPHEPGVYKFINSNSEIIYVGKAKDLKKRVSSYFATKKFSTTKQKLLLRAITNIEYTVVDSENDALLLENTLIKHNQPRFNVALKDDKSYPYICITNEILPKVFSVRNKTNNKDFYYGPYSSVTFVNTLLSLIKQLFETRSCNHTFTKRGIENNQYSSCLEFQIGNCLAPCIENQSIANYRENIDKIHSILKGNYNEVIGNLKLLMQEKAELYDFESANKIKNKLRLFELFLNKSIVANHQLDNVEIITHVQDDNVFIVNYMYIKQGSIIFAQTTEVEIGIEEEPKTILEHCLKRYNELLQINPIETILEEYLETQKSTIPLIGDKKKLLLLSKKNCNSKLLEISLKKEAIKQTNNTKKVLEKIKEDLNLKETPYRIECIDNSNFQGDFPVSACVVFINGKPAKKEYRIYNVKTVIGPNDFDTMKEVLTRKFRRAMEEETPFPQLIIIDGGKGQLSSSYEVLKEFKLENKIQLIGIAKKLEELYFPNDSIPLYIDKKSPTLQIIQRLRDEAHRFGITHHRNKITKALTQSNLTEIKGVGPKTIEILLQTFGSIEKLKLIDESILESIIGKSKTTKLKSYLNKKAP